MPPWKKLGISPSGIMRSARRNRSMFPDIAPRAQLRRWPMSDSNTIRGLERGLAVLQALHTKPACSLQDLNLLTRIPKPSLLRILRTLEQSGWAARRLADGRYRVGTLFDKVARIGDRYDPLAEAAGPVLERLCRTLSWPSDLMVPAGDHMEIRELSSRAQSVPDQSRSDRTSGTVAGIRGWTSLSRLLPGKGAQASHRCAAQIQSSR